MIARAFCIAAHSAVGQRRKYTGEPYWHHPQEVVSLLVHYVGQDRDMLSAAWLHDVLEDTGVTAEDLREVFSEHVVEMVVQLTDVSKPSDGNRAACKALDRLHLSKAWPIVKTIKLADLICNSRSIIERDPEFAKVYLEEKRLLLEVLKEGDQTLWEMAKKIVEDAPW